MSSIHCRQRRKGAAMEERAARCAINREVLRRRACGAVGSALPWHGRGREFESHQVHQIPQRLTKTERAKCVFWSPNGVQKWTPAREVPANAHAHLSRGHSKTQPMRVLPAAI